MNLAASPSITVNDTTAPSAPGLTVGSFTNASATGTTVYIRQGIAGGFTVTGTSSDTESGIDHLTFASGLGAGWTGGGADSSSPYAGVYTFNSSATAPAGSQDVTATNGWALTSSATPFTVVADTTAPAVTAPTVAAGYYTALSVPVTKNGGTDGGSGVDNTTSTVQRDEIGLTNGSCGTFPSSWSSVTLVGGNDTTVVSGNCYRYRELLSDNVGNQGTSAASNTAKVDTTAPSTPSLAFGGLSPNAYYDGSGTLYVRPSAGGTFTVTAQLDRCSKRHRQLHVRHPELERRRELRRLADGRPFRLHLRRLDDRAVHRTHGELYERRRHRFRQRDVLDRRRHDCAVRDGAERDRRLLHEQLGPRDEERRHGRRLQRRCEHQHARARHGDLDERGLRQLPGKLVDRDARAPATTRP